MESLDQGVSQHRSVIKFSLPGYLDHTEIARYLAALVRHLKMELAVPGIVTGWCEHGLGGWAHITTSCIDFMEYRLDGLALCHVDIYSCRAYDLAAAAGFTAGHFGVRPGELKAFRVVLEPA